MSSAAVGRDLVLTYGQRVAVDRSSFEIPYDSITAVIGPNGSGKSTLLNALAGLLKPERGRLEVLGDTPDRARRRIAYVVQTTKVNEALPVTVREVVTMGRYTTTGAYRLLSQVDRSAVETALQRLDLAHLTRRHLRELSGGERQRVFVAQGLAQDREMLLLDEPFTALDLVSAHTIDEVLRDERAAGRSVVVTTHSLAEAQAADHVLLLSQRVVASGPPEAALTLDALRAAYGPRVTDIEGRVFIDDAAHEPAAARHVHQERSLHVEPPGSGLHDE